jgi:hypothetical protein
MFMSVPSQDIDFQHHASWSPFCVQWFKARGDCLFCWYSWNIIDQFKLSFSNNIHKYNVGYVHIYYLLQINFIEHCNASVWHIFSINKNTDFFFIPSRIWFRHLSFHLCSPFHLFKIYRIFAIDTKLCME